MNYKTLNKSNNLLSLIKIRLSSMDKLNFNFKEILKNLSLISNYIFNDEPYLFDENRRKSDIYSSKEFYNYKSSTDLKLLQSRRTFL